MLDALCINGVEVLKHNSKKIVFVLFAFVCAFKLWLLYATNYYVNIGTYYDSHLEINQAINIISGNWLGPYNKFTLCKNPTYPIFLALLYVLHIPYAYGIGLLMIGTCLLFIKAIGPVVKNDYIRLGIFAFLLYLPACNEITYHYRNALSNWLALAVISCVVGIYLRKEEKVRSIIAYALTGMISMGAFWLLREDSIWLLPFVVSAYVIGVVTLIIKKKNVLLFALVSLLPVCGIPIFHHVIASINYKHYGIYAANDRMETNTARLLGALIEIDDGADLDNDVWVSGEAIELAKKVSPTFASFNLSPFDAWSKHGDHSIWALRDVLTDSGYFVDAKNTDEVCGKAVLELRMAFKNGKLKKKSGLKLSNTSGMFSFNEVKKAIKDALKVVKYHIEYEPIKYDFEKLVCVSNDVDLQLYEQTLGVALIRNTDGYESMGAKWESYPMFKLQNENHKKQLSHNLFVLKLIRYIYRHVDLLLFAIATIGLMCFVYKLKQYSHEVDFTFEFVIIMVGVLLLSYVNAFLVCLFAQNFPEGLYYDIAYNYTIVEYLLLSIYEVFGFVCFITFVNEIMATRKKDR